MRSFSRILIAVFFCLVGCKSENTPDPVPCARRIAEYTNIVADDIRSRNLPDLESVEPWENGYGPGLKLTTAHYEIRTTLLNRRLLCKIPRFVETAYRAYNSQLPQSIETTVRFPIYLFAERLQWEHFTCSFAGEHAQIFCKIKAGAYCHNDACVAYDIGDERTFLAIGHEGWHQFNGRVFKYRLPSWLDEGVAMLFETHRADDETIYFVPTENNYRLSSLKKTLAKNKIIPLRELTAINPGQVIATDETEDVMAFYSQSYALVRFLREADSGRRLRVYHQLLADGLLGKWPLDDVSREIAIDRNIPRTILWNHIVGTLLFQKYIGEDFEQIEAEYLTFCNEITRN
ncbi:MAG: hypothetical protein JW715_10725 [Sedimentisphaerales bacterium]|nr:hypothetical protein [Sedimentisphaerales bacterium]